MQWWKLLTQHQNVQRATWTSSSASCSAFLICGQFGKINWCFPWPLCVHAHDRHFPCHLRCQMDSTDMFGNFFFPSAEGIVGQGDNKKNALPFFFPSGIWATEVAVSHLWPIHLELTLPAKTFGGHKQCWELLGESLCLCFCIFQHSELCIGSFGWWILRNLGKRRQVFDIQSYL